VGNKLRAVADNSGSTAQLGDFQDNNTTADDYGYDLNGNQVTDLNRRIGSSTGVNLTAGGGIVYSYLNLPWQIALSNTGGTAKGTITYIFDANGQKLEKRVNELASSSNNQTAINTITTYIGGYTYSNNVLQSFTHTDGRVRPVSSANTPYVFDYFIKDHLGNTRAVLTDQQNTINPPVATVEESPAVSLTTEESYFSMNTADITNMQVMVPSYLTATRNSYPNNNGNPPYNSNPNSNVSATSQYMYKLNGQTGDKTGLGITLKVMAGDKVNIWADTYYHLNTTVNNSFSIAPSGVSAFLAAFAGTPAIEAIHGVTAGALQGSPVTPGDVTSWLESEPVPTSAPKAYVNWILFDEQFRPVKTGTNTGFISIANTPADNVVLSSATATITSSGYLYVYCSNESNIDVYFDNLQVQQVQGPLLEDQHYYPFGLTMAGISDMATMPQNIENLYRFQGQELQHKEFSDGSGLEMYNYKHRFDDPQTGRFGQIDPLADKYLYNSTYAFSENKVTAHIELDGKESWQAYVANMWREAGITSSTDPQQYVYKNVIVPMADPRTWINGYLAAGQLLAPMFITHILTAGMGDRFMLEAEIAEARAGFLTVGSTSLVSEPLGEQWGTGGLFASESRSTLVLGTKQGYWGTVTVDPAANGITNMVANEAQPGNFVYLKANVDLDWSNPASRQFFFDHYNKPILDATIMRGDPILMLDNPYNINAIFPGGDVGKGFNFYGMEVEYLSRLGFTFENGQAIYPGALDPNWHAPMVLPGTMNTGGTPSMGTPTGAGNDQQGNGDEGGGDDGGGDPD
jgi:RHS repeat-associated protein